MSILIKILVVGSYRVLCEGLCKLLAAEPDIEVVGCSDNSSDALRLISETMPEVVLVGLELKDGSGLTIVARIVTANPDCSVIVLSESDSEDNILKAFEAGAVGYIGKDDPFDQIVESIRFAHSIDGANSPKLSRGATNQLIGKLQASLASRKTLHDFIESDLTRREIQILGILAKGKSNKEIANDLFITEKTVKNHLHKAYFKLGCRSRTEAMLKAIAVGLVDP